jgi:hypothetical protein
MGKAPDDCIGVSHSPVDLALLHRRIDLVVGVTRNEPGLFDADQMGE